ncbi:MAG: ATP synthase F1 subunit delta [Candidatus Methylomirabilis sp.]|nr:ATP synthase F1 subunit delta [Candidatus Methylomirabilis sp.]
MRAAGLARRYAKALADVASDQHLLEAVGRDLHTVVETIKRTREITIFFASPAVPLTDKRRVLHTIAEGTGVKPLTANFLNLILEKRRFAHLGEIVLAYEELTDERLGRGKATVTSAAPLPEPIMRGTEGAPEGRNRERDLSGGAGRPYHCGRFCGADRQHHLRWIRQDTTEKGTRTPAEERVSLILKG